jgi:(p)ppGpp synthase/HD superfamily hydrolase
VWIEALNFAFQRHRGQVDIHGLVYELHVLRVIAGLSRMGINRPEALAAAALHDVLEDCPVTLEEIVDRFGPEVGRLVLLLTHKKDETYKAYIERVDTDRLARAIKLADLEDNSLSWRQVPNGRKQGLYASAIVRLQSGEWPT